MCSPAAFLPVLVSAPGKVILHGEHAVVYGHSAVAASLGIRSRVHLAPLPQQQEEVTGGTTEEVQVSFPDVGIAKTWSCTDLAREVLKLRPDKEEMRRGSQTFQVNEPLNR